MAAIGIGFLGSPQVFVRYISMKDEKQILQLRKQSRLLTRKGARHMREGLFDVTISMCESLYIHCSVV